MGPPVDTTKDGRTICSHSKSFLVSFCNLGRWCSRYSLGVIDEELRQFSWVNADDFMSPKIDNGVTGIHVFSGGVLVCIQSPMPRVAWLDPDLRFRRAFRLMKIKDPHSITSFGREALIVCSQRNRLYSLDLDTGCESCVFTAERSCSDVVHLNGVALRDGHPIVSLFGRERPKKPRQGRVVDTETKKVLVEHIMEPHSPTVNEGILYVLGSATGELHRFSSSGTNVILLGGYVRGLAVTPNGILVGRSAWRAARRRLGGLRKPPGPEIDPHSNPWQRSAIMRLNQAGQIIHAIDFSFFGPEIYDIAELENAPPATRLFEDAAYRRLDALQEAQVRLNAENSDKRAPQG